MDQQLAHELSVLTDFIVEQHERVATHSTRYCVRSCSLDGVEIKVELWSSNKVPPLPKPQAEAS